MTFLICNLCRTALDGNKVGRCKCPSGEGLYWEGTEWGGTPEALRSASVLYEAGDAIDAETEKNRLFHGLRLTDADLATCKVKLP